MWGQYTGVVDLVQLVRASDSRMGFFKLPSGSYCHERLSNTEGHSLSQLPPVTVTATTKASWSWWGAVPPSLRDCKAVTWLSSPVRYKMKDPSPAWAPHCQLTCPPPHNSILTWAHQWRASFDLCDTFLKKSILNYGAPDVDCNCSDDAYCAVSHFYSHHSSGSYGEMILNSILQNSEKSHISTLSKSLFQKRYKFTFG